MSTFDMAWANADPDATGGSDEFDPPADGTYTVALTDAAAIESKKGNAGVILQWTNPADQHVWKSWHGFKSEAQANMTKRQVRDLGVPVDEVMALEQLDAQLKTKIGGYFTVEVKTNGSFRNTIIDGPATGALPTSDVPVDTSDFAPKPAAAAAALPDDDIPF